MGGIDKVAADIGGRPLLAWTLDALAAADSTRRMVLVTAAERVDEVRAAPWLPAGVVAVVAGGRRRQDSVAAGFRALDDAGDLAAEDDPVLVHDGARPLVQPALVDAVAQATARHGAAIPVIPVADTLKRLDGGLVGETVDRSELAAAQTPQGARRRLLRQALAGADPAQDATDEASLLEAAGIPVHVVAGDPANVKVTVPEDLARVMATLRGHAVTRTGFGIDRHPFGPGSPLRLGGVDIPGAPRLHGHSDGDAALHAIATAMLSGAGRGDIGQLFPADPRTPRGIDSATLLAESIRVVEVAGWRVAAVAVAIEGARPRLAGHFEAMARAIAELLSVAPSAVGVGASTGNLTSAEGAGRSISATALVTLSAIDAR